MSTLAGHLLKVLKIKSERLRLSEHVQRRNSDYIGRRMLSVELIGGSPKGTTK